MKHRAKARLYCSRLPVRLRHMSTEVKVYVFAPNLLHASSGVLIQFPTDKSQFAQTP